MGGVIRQPGRSGVLNTAGGRQSSFFSPIINQLQIILASQNQAVFSCLDILVNSDVLITRHTQDCRLTIAIGLPTEPAEHTIRIVKKAIDVPDQSVILERIKIDGINCPDWLIQNQSRFCFHDQIHQGSRYWQPPGEWIFTCQTPIITWILDQKILHESNYNQDYKYPWSYKLGPDSVQQIGTQLQTVMSRVITDL